jgi:hypothetical protein
MSLFKRIKDPLEGSMHVVAATQLDPSRLRAPCRIQWDQVMTTSDPARLHADQLAAELRGEEPASQDDGPGGEHETRGPRVELRSCHARSNSTSTAASTSCR